MIPEVLDVWLEAIAAWDGENQAKLMTFLATIRAAMGERDYTTTHTLCEAMLHHEPPPKDGAACARVCLDGARRAPRKNAVELLDMATGFIEQALDGKPGDSAVSKLQADIEDAQSALKRAGYGDEDEGTRDPRRAPSPVPSFSSSGSGSIVGIAGNLQKDPSPQPLTFAEQYAKWKAEAGECTEEEYIELEAQSKRDMLKFEREKAAAAEQKKAERSDEK